MNSSRLLLDDSCLNDVAATLTLHRLSKYLRATDNNPQQALRLYVLNARVSAAVMIDLHYIEIALHNRFDRELAAKFGPEWFNNSNYLSLLDDGAHNILIRAHRQAIKHWPKGETLPRGKLIAELTFGFWLRLIASNLEHKLWVPCLHRAFAHRPPPKRAQFKGELERLRQLRNRVAHHEPIFHLDLLDAHRRILEVSETICPATTRLMASTSMVRKHLAGLDSPSPLSSHFDPMSC